MGLIDFERAEKKSWWKQLPQAERTGLSIAESLASIVSDCTDAHLRMIDTCYDLNISHLYFRFNVDRGLENVALDDHEAVSEIKSASAKYIAMLSIERKPEDCAKLLRYSLGSSQLLQLQSQVTDHREQIRRLEQRMQNIEFGVPSNGPPRMQVVFSGQFNAGRNLTNVGRISDM